MNKQYIGDGVYVEIDDQTDDLVLTTEDGIRVTDRIVLDAGVWQALREYEARQRGRIGGATV